MYDTTILNKTKNLIQQKYFIDEKRASMYAEMALSQLSSHGGNPYDFNSIENVVNVVVKSWIK